MLVNALRAHLAEFGVIAPQGLRNVGKLIAIIRDEDDAHLPGLARQVPFPFIGSNRAEGGHSQTQRHHAGSISACLPFSALEWWA
jgi:hypothetical protein